MTHTHAPARILLLGGIGSGKSAVARLLGELGAVVVDADRLGHEVLLAEGYDAVASRWPEVASAAGRAIDRRRLGAIVFEDAAELADLESITHPLIAARIATLVGENASDTVVVEMPLLKDLVTGEWVRIAVTTPRPTRVNRLLARGMSEAEIEARMAVQPSDADFAAAADHVIENSGTLDDLGRAVLTIWSYLVTG